MEDHICHLFTVEGVQLTHVRDIKQEPNMLEIWCIIPHDMRLMMHHVFSSLTLIQSLRDDNQPTSSSDDKFPDAAPLHDSPPAHGSGG